MEEIRVATAMFPTLSLLNHSCRPNTSLVFSTGTVDDPGGSPTDVGFNQRLLGEGRQSRGVTVTVRAARYISAGEEILHCYGEICDSQATFF